ncbi:MAG: polyphosphate polymerase domain-containing protein, partial [Deltaproteobacteria bacterium]|nr:polyphosphate polymerase domain-containing protein [Deltaproteobacteria bacterium]
MIKRFNRFELKYIITAAQRDLLVPEILKQMRPDVAASPNGVYAVTSLYYDTVDRAFMRAKIEGIKFRRKLRIRCYGQVQGEDPKVAVEIKQRINRTTQKRRLFVPLATAYTLCAGAEPLLADPDDQRVAGEVVFLARALLLQPTCVVGYLRHAFVGGPYEPGLRVTLDHALWASIATSGLSTREPRHALLRPDLLVM